ncbi:type VI secretion system membrane subunit TssM [Acetobacter sp. DsW_063]|uniref:type VI secretion system membrane subunit TssM n=1 Tax=Acetobacter sp. DsW_063 TaxID=1514894 RepID=UPI000A39F18D|nr:type VI secretion system membrane subunit TssM [Acetobacter sp. DsW_063]
MSQVLSLLRMLFRNRWSTAFGIAVMIGTMLWFYLPFVPFFAPTLRRAIAVAAACLIVAAVTYVLHRRRRTEESKVRDALIDKKEGQQDEQAANDEVRALRKKLQEAIVALRRRGVRRLYELPWYILIGPPGSGKTTSLRHSGLHFPLEKDGDEALRGVGGTRLCDWWFAEEAVLIDTAGRYTTQDSDRAVDRAGWLGFLDALRKARPRQPVNGLLVMISLVEIIEATPETLEAHARQIRLRINEVTERLGMRIPVYLMFNKADRLAGFDAFFDDLDSKSREQVWGMTFRLEQGQDAFLEEFRLLLGRLEARLIERLQAERGADRRALISGFPLQVASLLEPLSSFLQIGFSGSRVDQAPLVRGVYFTSATQVGAPLDRLAGALVKSFGIDQKRVGAPEGNRGRAYFLTRLIREVVLGEALLVSQAPDRYRLRRMVRSSALAALVFCTVVGLVLIWRAEMEARAMVQQRLEIFAAYRDAVTPLAGKAVDSDADLVQVCDVLDKISAAQQPQPDRLARFFHLAPRGAIDDAGRSAYENALRRQFYPRLVWRVEHEMRQHMHDPGVLYEATRVYLLLGGLGPREPGIVEDWFRQAWGGLFPGSLNVALRERLDHHLDALLALPPPAEAHLDGDLIRQARIAFGHVTPAERIYGRLRAGALPADIHAWSPAGVLGAVADTVFSRRSGAPMTDGVPAFYTGQGFAVAVRKDLPSAARAVADESWVVGRDPDVTVNGSAVGGLESEVAQLWVDDARKHWDRVLNDLSLRLTGDRSQVESSLYMLSSPQSPLRDMVASIADAQTVPMPKPPQSKEQGAGAAVAQQGPLDPMDVVAASWNDSNKPLFSLIHPEGSGAPAIETLLRLIGQLSDELSRGVASPGALPMTAGASLDPAQRLRTEASRQPEPVATWLQQIAESGGSALGQAARQSASGAFNGAEGPGKACTALVKNHFPFDVEATTDAPLDGFVRVFAPGGLLDQYFQTSVAPYTDQSGTTWRLHPTGGVTPPFTAQQLAAFQRTAAIRKAFFPAGGAPFVSFPISLKSSPEFSLSLGAATVHPDATAHLTWPGSDGLSPATITRTRKDGAQTLAQAQGPWAPFRLLQQGFQQPAEGGQRVFLFPDGEEVHVTVPSDGAFVFDLLRGFSCPAVP